MEFDRPPARTVFEAPSSQVPQSTQPSFTAPSASQAVSLADSDSHGQEARAGWIPLDLGLRPPAAHEDSDEHFLAAQGATPPLADLCKGH